MKGSVAIILIVCALAKAASFSNKITGGQPAAPHSFPHQTALFIEVPQGTAFCGGSIISENVILTAAHCVENAKNVTVRVGAHNINTPESTTQSFVASNWIVHQNWSMLFKKNDIALVILNENIVLNAQVQKIELPNADEVIAVGQEVTISGWGIISDQSETISSELFYVTSEILSLDVCNQFYFGIVGNTQLCMKGDNGKSACSGDSGGALVVKYGDRTVQYGIASFVLIFGCEVGIPSVYTNVASYIGWINANLPTERYF